jgi:hypothetical protein
MKYTIEKVDFDEAVKQPFVHHLCLIAQFSLRNKFLYTSGRPKVFGINDAKAEAARLIFDANFKIPGDEKKPALIALRESLPIEIEPISIQ